MVLAFIVVFGKRKIIDTHYFLLKQNITDFVFLSENLSESNKLLNYTALPSMKSAVSCVLLITRE